MCCPVLRRTQPHSGKAKTEPHPIQIPFSNPHSHNCTEMSKHKQTGALAAHLISTKHCRIAADMTRVFKQAGFRHTHTPHFREASQARLKTRHCYKPKQTVNSTKWTTTSFSQKRSTDSASRFFYLLVRFHLTHVFFHLGACPITPTFCQCNCMHILIHMQAVQQSF